MSRSKSEMVIYKHGLLWWLIIGWWWRPSYFLLYYILAKLNGDKSIKLETYDRRLTIRIDHKQHTIKWWLLVGWWWRSIEIVSIVTFCILFGFKFEFRKSYYSY